MTMLTIRSAAVAAMLLATGPALGAGCLETPARLTGTLGEVEAAHPNGTIIRAIQLTLDQPVQVEGMLADGCVEAKVIHVAPIDKAAERRLRARLGKTATIVSPDVFEAHTAWHVGEGVAMRARLAR
jgi:hypothetical protein